MLWIVIFAMAVYKGQPRHINRMGRVSICRLADTKYFNFFSTGVLQWRRGVYWVICRSKIRVVTTTTWISWFGNECSSLCVFWYRPFTQENFNRSRIGQWIPLFLKRWDISLTKTYSSTSRPFLEWLCNSLQTDIYLEPWYDKWNIINSLWSPVVFFPIGVVIAIWNLFWCTSKTYFCNLGAVFMKVH